MSYNSSYTGAEVEDALNLAKTALQEHQDLSGYQTKITIDNKLAYSLISGTPTLGDLAYKSSLAASDIPDLSGTYLPKSGGTISGELIMASYSGTYSYGIAFYSQNKSGSLGIKGDLLKWTFDGVENTLIHSGNIGSYNAGSATKLQTARTIWGQSFNGTEKVSGNVIGTYFHIEDSATNAYYKLTNSQGQVGYLQILINNGGLAIGSTSAKSLIVENNGNTKVNGNIYATGAITPNSSSDIRLKDNINTMTDDIALYTIMALNPVTFTWNSKATELCSWLVGESQGFIAQEYEQIIPNSGSLMWNEYRGIDYNRVLPYIVKVEQNHETRIQQIVSVEQNHEQRIRQLEQELATLKQEYYGQD